MRTSIRFKNQELRALRGRLLSDLDRESFAVLLAKERVIDDLRVVTVVDIRYPHAGDFKRQTICSLTVSFDTFMRPILEEVSERLDVDAVIDVHTHPFACDDVRFSAVDDNDEKAFALYLHERGLKYGSIVFGRSDYEARWWSVGSTGVPSYDSAFLKAQTALEDADVSKLESVDDGVDLAFDRSIRALGLDGMRLIASASTVTVVGVGGLGSIIAEHLAHMGFNELVLIDYDTLEVTNMNRIVGATYSDALQGRRKVEAVRDHLLAINPNMRVEAIAASALSDVAELAVAKSDFVLVATDNHASRFRVQGLCFKYYVPFVTAGVNITVEDGRVKDMSGEVILVRMGDSVCLSCLGRVDYDAVAHELHPDPAVRDGLVARGYVKGADVKEPAVKTLNTHLATLAVDVLVNQYTGRRRDVPILVYEDNDLPTIYEDRESVERRALNCSVCGV